MHGDSHRPQLLWRLPLPVSTPGSSCVGINVSFRLILYWTRRAAHEISPECYGVAVVLRCGTRSPASWNSSRSEAFSLLDPGTIIDRFFIFDFVGSNTVSGCYHQIRKSDDSISRCYPMTGARTSSSTLSSLKRAQPNTTAAQAELAEIEAVEKLGDEIQMEVDPKIIRVLEDLREVLRQ